MLQFSVPYLFFNRFIFMHAIWSLASCCKIMRAKSYFAGELHQQWDHELPAACASRQRLPAKLHHLWEVRRQRSEHTSCLCLPERQAPLSRWRPQFPHARPQVSDLESHQPDGRLLELWEIPRRARGRALQEIQQKVPHHWHRTWHSATVKINQNLRVASTSEMALHPS